MASKTTQILQMVYIDEDKLESKLKELFGKDYHIEVLIARVLSF